MSSDAYIWSQALEVAQDVKGLTSENLKKMRLRGRIPAKWHHPIVVAARAKGIDLSHEDLANLANQ